MRSTRSRSVSCSGSILLPTRHSLPQKKMSKVCNIVGGVISPLLANIALHGMEEALEIKHRKRGELNSQRALVRYADDFCVFCESQEDAEAVKHILSDWLNKRGLVLAPKKLLISLTIGCFTKK